MQVEPAAGPSQQEPQQASAIHEVKHPPASLNDAPSTVAETIEQAPKVQVMPQTAYPTSQHASAGTNNPAIVPEVSSTASPNGAGGRDSGISSRTQSSAWSRPDSLSSSSQTAPSSSIVPQTAMPAHPMYHTNTYGSAYRPAPPRSYTTHSYDAESSRLSAADKGKGRAPLNPTPTMAPTTVYAQHPPSATKPAREVAAAPSFTARGHARETGTIGPEPLRGKRVPKKRRLSASGEIDPDALQADGTLKKSRRGQPGGARAGGRGGHASSSGSASMASSGLVGSVGAVSAPPVRLTKAEQAYIQRLENNSRRAPLMDMAGQCPLWAYTQRALMCAADYLRNPTTTEGASVDIAEGGVARGVILEGQHPAAFGFWGEGKSTGTLIFAIGPARPRRIHDHSAEKPMAEGAQPPHATATNGVTAHSTATESNGSRAGDPAQPPDPARNEVTVVQALLATQRARRPLGLAISQDYSAAPFRVPRPFIVLGWFWITDAWVEPEPQSMEADCAPEDQLVRWRFRFDWCTGGDSSPGAEMPWWSRRSEAGRDLLPSDLSAQDQETILQELSHPPNSSLRTNVSASDADSGGGGAFSVSHGGSTTCQRRDDVPVYPRSTAQVVSSARCNRCHWVNSRVFDGEPICFNEACDLFFKEQRDEYTVLAKGNPPWHDIKSRKPLIMRTDIARYTPRALGLSLRPPDPPSRAADAINPSQRGADFWRAWVCKHCKMANERRRWCGWDCDSCDKSVQPERYIYAPSQLRQSIRPTSTGPRADDGYPRFPDNAMITRSAALFEDDIVVVNFHVTSLFGPDSELMLAMYIEGESQRGGTVGTMVPDHLLYNLQRQGREEVNLRRHTINAEGVKQTDKCLSPFYTMLCGPGPVPSIECFPTSTPILWKYAPPTSLDAMHYMNERAGRMFPGQPERFNSLMIVAFPPQISHRPRFTVPAFTYYAMMVIGPDAEIKLRAVSRPAPKAHGASAPKNQPPSSLTLQHGDVLGIRTGPEPLEVTVSLEGFGFFFLARQIYKSIPDRRDLEAQMKTDDPPEAFVRTTPASIQTVPDADNSSPPRSTATATGTTRNWYVGPRPLDPTQPLRLWPSLRPEMNRTYKTWPDHGIASHMLRPLPFVILDAEPDEPKLLSPAPSALPPQGAARRKQAEELQDLGIKKVARPRKPRQKRVSAVAGSELGSSAGTPEAAGSSAMDIDADSVGHDPAHIKDEPMALDNNHDVEDNTDEVGSVIEAKMPSSQGSPLPSVPPRKGGRKSGGGQAASRTASSPASTAAGERNSKAKDSKTKTKPRASLTEPSS